MPAVCVLEAPETLRTTLRNKLLDSECGLRNLIAYVESCSGSVRTWQLGDTRLLGVIVRRPDGQALCWTVDPDSEADPRRSSHEVLEVKSVPLSPYECMLVWKEFVRCSSQFPEFALKRCEVLIWERRKALMGKWRRSREIPAEWPSEAFFKELDWLPD